jgi:hypothetical protein
MDKVRVFCYLAVAAVVWLALRSGVVSDALGSALGMFAYAVFLASAVVTVASLYVGFTSPLRSRFGRGAGEAGGHGFGFLPYVWVEFGPLSFLLFLAWLVLLVDTFWAGLLSFLINCFVAHSVVAAWPGSVESTSFCAAAGLFCIAAGIDYMADRLEMV